MIFDDETSETIGQALVALSLLAFIAAIGVSVTGNVIQGGGLLVVSLVTNLVGVWINPAAPIHWQRAKQ